MTDRPPARPPRRPSLSAVAQASLVAFVLVLALLAWQLRSGRDPAANVLTMRFLQEVCSIPTAPFAEQYVVRYVEEAVAR